MKRFLIKLFSDTVDDLVPLCMIVSGLALLSHLIYSC